MCLRDSEQHRVQAVACGKGRAEAWFGATGCRVNEQAIYIVILCIYRYSYYTYIYCCFELSIVFMAKYQELFTFGRICFLYRASEERQLRSTKCIGSTDPVAVNRYRQFLLLDHRRELKLI